jgi:hypothetical protein
VIEDRVGEIARVKGGDGGGTRELDQVARQALGGEFVRRLRRWRRLVSTRRYARHAFNGGRGVGALRI